MLEKQTILKVIKQCAVLCCHSVHHISCERDGLAKAKAGAVARVWVWVCERDIGITFKHTFNSMSWNSMHKHMAQHYHARRNGKSHRSIIQRHLAGVLVLDYNDYYRYCYCLCHWVFIRIYGVLCIVNVDWIFHAFVQSNYSNEQLNAHCFPSFSSLQFVIWSSDTRLLTERWPNPLFPLSCRSVPA